MGNPRTLKHILIIRSDRIGDVILTTPAIHALRQAYPQSRISVLVSSGNEVLLQGNPDVDQVLVDNRKAGDKKPTGFWELVSLLRRNRFDCVVNYHTKRRTNLAVFLAGIPLRIGYKNDKFGFLLNLPLKDERTSGKKHEAQYCLDVLKPLGVSGDARTLFLPVPQQYGAWFEEMCRTNNIDRNRPLVVLHAGASDPAKRWPENKFIELMTYMQERQNCTFVLIGTPDIQAQSQQIVQGVSFPVTDLTGKTNLGQLMYLIHQCQLMISNDSGPVHIAAAYDKPVVSIFTRNQPGINPERWQPLGAHSRYVSVPEEKSMANPKAGDVSAEYLQLIDTEAVIESVDDVFKLC